LGLSRLLSSGFLSDWLNFFFFAVITFFFNGSLLLSRLGLGLSGLLSSRLLGDWLNFFFAFVAFFFNGSLLLSSLGLGFRSFNFLLGLRRLFIRIIRRFFLDLLGWLSLLGLGLLISNGLLEFLFIEASIAIIFNLSLLLLLNIGFLSSLSLGSGIDDVFNIRIVRVSLDLS